MIHFSRTLQAAVVMFTRLPLASHRLEQLHFQYAHYFLPVVGVLVGLLMVLAYQFTALYISADTAILIALITGILATGALHEDGFADCCDGFGGGQSREKIIEIMKDSRLGSFGVLGLIGLIGLKVLLLKDIPIINHVNALISMSIMARIVPIIIMALLPYAAGVESKMTDQMPIRLMPLSISMIFALICVLLLNPWQFVLVLGFSMLLPVFLCRWYFQQKLQGYNGDCLGASEQIAECYLLLIMAIYY